MKVESQKLKVNTKKDNKQKICLFGGTFNPVHNGHIAMAKAVYDHFELDKMIVLPSNISPHKSSNILDPIHRLNMVKCAFEQLKEDIDISDFEINSEGISYTFKTLQHFRSMYPEAVVFFLTGTDIFATIQTWRNWELLFEYTNFIVVNRKEKPFKTMKSDMPEELQNRFTCYDNIDTRYGKIVCFETEEVPISSTEIRNDLLNNKRNDFLPEVVYDYINKNNLYRGSNV